MARRVKNPFPPELEEPVLDVLREYGWVEDTRAFAELFGVTPIQMAGFLRTKKAKAAILDHRTIGQTVAMREAIQRARRAPTVQESNFLETEEAHLQGGYLHSIYELVEAGIVSAINAVKDKRVEDAGKATKGDGSAPWD